jgi:KDO2-lipid IV(A) lauroyltransferase
VTGAGGAAWFALSRAQRRAALDNYAVVLGLAPSDPAVRRTARRAFQNYADMLLDFIAIASLTKQELLERVTYAGREHLDAALDAGRGLVFALPHMGSWDMAGSTGGALGYRLHAIAERFPGSLDEAVVEDREHFGIRVIPLGRSAAGAVLGALRQGDAVALVADIAPAGGGTEVVMFGHRATVAAGPAAFCVKTGAPLLPASIRHTAPGRYHVQIEAPLAAPAEGDRRVAAAELSQRLAERFEHFIRENPDDWYAFRPRFRPL